MLNSRTAAQVAQVLGFSLLLTASAVAQIGTRFPSEKKIVPDPVTGVPLEFLTSTPAGDSKIYQTHHQWTSDGKWLIFRSNRVRGQAMAVNEETGDIVQVTENGYTGMLCLAEHSMNLYFARIKNLPPVDANSGTAYGAPAAVRDAPATVAARAADAAVPPAGAAPGAPAGAGRRGPPSGPAEIVRVDLGKLFADSAAGKVGPATDYEHVCGVVPTEMGAVGDVALDPTEDFVYARVGSKEYAAQHLAPDMKAEAPYGPRNMGAGPTGLASINLHTGEVKFIVAVPFQIGHVQTNPWVPGEIVFCWETGGKAPQRTWTVRSDGTGLRPLYPEAPYEWITHEAVITKDEVAIAIIGHQKVDTKNAWGIAGTQEHPTGLGIVNLRTREMRIAGQLPFGDPGRSVWHVNGSGDGRWAVADDFKYRLWLIDRHTSEMILLADLGHMTTAQDHIHPTFSADGTKVEVECAMLSENKRAMNICVVPIPPSWLKRTYTDKIE
jgi:oligogalacturonide lyase